MSSRILTKQLNQILRRYKPSIENNEYLFKQDILIIPEQGKTYIISITNDMAMNKNSILNVNWNNGEPPKYKNYLCEILAVDENLIKIVGSALSDDFLTSINYIWEGWLSLDSFVIKKELS